MKNYILSLALIIVFLFLLIGFTSWSNSYAIHGNAVGVNSFSVVSPLVIGLLIIGAITILILVSVGID